MRFETEDWVIKLKNGKFVPTHKGCGREVTMFDKDGRPSAVIDGHDEDSYCVCSCMIISPKLKEFEIIVESIEEK